MRRTSLSTGFSLIDTLLGVAMFLIVTVALIQFTMTTLHAADNLSAQLQAQNAAREGLEIMENLRGTDAISFVTWKTPQNLHPHQELKDLLQFSGLATQQEVCATVAPRTGIVPWEIHTIRCPAANEDPKENTALFSKENENHQTILTHDSTGEASGLYRYIRIRKAKDTETLRDFWSSFKDTRQDPQQDDDVVEVDAVVSWRLYGHVQQLTLKKILADWYE